MKRKVLAIILSLAMVVCLMPTFTFAAGQSKMVVGDKNGDGVIEFVSLGDSIALGFGTGGCDSTNIYTYEWRNGYERAPETAYAKVVANNHDNINLWTGTQCAVRAEDVINLIDVTAFGADDYFYKNLYENTLRNCYIDPSRSGPMNPLTYLYENPKYYSDMPTVAMLNRNYKEHVQNADIISITAGGNNYFAYLTAKLIAILQDPIQSYTMYALPAGLYYDYVMQYVYDYVEGDTVKPAGTDEGITEVDKINGRTYSNVKLDGRTPLFCNMVVGEPGAMMMDMTQMVVKKFSDYHGQDITYEMTGITYTDNDEGISEEDYLEDIQEFYGQFDESFKTIDSIDKYNAKMLEVYEEMMNAQVINEDLSKYYKKSVAIAFETMKAGAIAAAKIADRTTQAPASGFSIERTTRALFDFLKSFIYSMAAMNEALPEVVSYIHSINPDAKIAITGLPRAFCDYSVDIGNGQPYNLGDSFPGFYEQTYQNIQKIANDNKDFCVAIDIQGAQMISQQVMDKQYKACIAGTPEWGVPAMTPEEIKAQLGLEKYSRPDSNGNYYHWTQPVVQFMALLYDMTLSHPSDEGHKYIASQIENAFDFSLTPQKTSIFTRIVNFFKSLFDRGDRTSLLERLFNFRISDLFKFNIGDIFKPRLLSIL